MVRLYIPPLPQPTASTLVVVDFFLMHVRVLPRTCCGTTCCMPASCCQLCDKLALPAAATSPGCCTAAG
jgi:hypothetical protein